MSFRLADNAIGELEDIVRRYPQASGALLPTLHLVQREVGHIPEEAIEFVAQKLGLSAARVYGVVTFYPVFRLRPPPRHLIRVCSTLSCRLMGAQKVVELAREKLDAAGVDRSTAEVEEVDCLACCGMGPVMMMDGELHQNLTPKRIEQIIERLRLSTVDGHGD